MIRKLILAFLACASLVRAAAAADLDDIKARGVLRHIGIQYANFVTAERTGFDVELVQGFARSLGVRYELVLSDFINAMPDLLGAEVVRTGDAVTTVGTRPVRGDMIAAGFTVLPWREQLLLYSKATFPSQVLLVARVESAHRPVAAQASLREDIQATRRVLGVSSLLVMEKTCLDPSNYGLLGRGIDIRYHRASTKLDDMVPSLLRGDAEFTLLDVPDAVLDLQRWAGRIKIIGPVSEHQDLAAAFPKTAPRLREAFDAYLRGIRADGSYERLVNKYYPGVRSYFPEFFRRAP